VIRVTTDDLATLAVDAVLRAANESLDPVTPSAARLDQAAGARFVEQRRLQSPLEVGAAVVTGGGNLAAPLVVHVVIQGEDTPAGRDTVRRALTSAWQRTTDWRLAHIATHLIGTGAGALSLEDATRLMMETFRHHSAIGGCPTSLAIVVERDADREIVQAIVTGAGT
jgi:O-acetyl-ADP-ribose deacetylase (regulator of RNase III)